MTTHGRPRRALPLLFLASIGCLATACGGTETKANESDSKQNAGESNGDESAPSHPAEVAASEVFRCIKEVDLAGIKPLLSEGNRKFDDAKILEFLEEESREFKKLKAIEEIRAIPEDHGNDGGVWAKLEEEDGETYVIVLNLENGKYVFEDTNTPSTRDYEAATKVWP